MVLAGLMGCIATLLATGLAGLALARHRVASPLVYSIALLASVVGTTARASRENVRSLGYSIYYTMVNIGGTLGPILADWAHAKFGVENVFRAPSVAVSIAIWRVVNVNVAFVQTEEYVVPFTCSVNG